MKNLKVTVSEEQDEILPLLVLKYNQKLSKFKSDLSFSMILLETIKQICVTEKTMYCKDSHIVLFSNLVKIHH